MLSLVWTATWLSFLFLFPSIQCSTCLDCPLLAAAFVPEYPPCPTRMGVPGLQISLLSPVWSNKLLRLTPQLWNCLVTKLDPCWGQQNHTSVLCSPSWSMGTMSHLQEAFSIFPKQGSLLVLVELTVPGYISLRTYHCTFIFKICKRAQHILFIYSKHEISLRAKSLTEKYFHKITWV